MTSASPRSARPTVPARGGFRGPCPALRAPGARSGASAAIAFAVLVALVTDGRAHAQTQSEAFRLRAKGAGSNDFFGTSVAISGSLVGVGAPLADGAVLQSGAVYLFDPATGAQRGRLVAEGGVSRDEFGASLAIDGGLVVVGAPFDDQVDLNAGAAYLFDATTGAQLLKLTAESGQSLGGSRATGEAFAGFGQSVAIGGGRVVVGSPYTFANDNPTGRAFVFEIETATLVRTLVPDSPGATAFGAEVALSGDRVVVSAPFDATPGYALGTAFVFDAVTGERLFTLLPDAPGGNFGESLAVDGDLVVVGAPSQPVGGEHLYGAAYVFDLRTGERLRTLVPGDADGRGFGRSVSVADGTVVVGAWDAVEGGVFTAGAAYAFDLATGAPIAKFLPSDGGPGRGFGFSAAVRDGRAVFGSYLDEDPANLSGAAHLFVLGPTGGCLADIDGDGRVDAADLGAALDAWGPCGADCLADLDGDGRVDAADLAILLGAWGGCG
jgi:hypothetical protein